MERQEGAVLLKVVTAVDTMDSVVVMKVAVTATTMEVEVGETTEEAMGQHYLL